MQKALWLPLVAVVAAVSGCSSPLLPEYRKVPDKSLVIGKKHKGVTTLIKSVNGKTVVSGEEAQPVDAVWLVPGSYTITLSYAEPDVEDTSVKLNAMTNVFYELTTEILDEKPHVRIREYDVSRMGKRPVINDASSRIPALRGL